ncbi:MAG: glutaminase A [Ilumatobacteraceae bacterium]
MPGADAAPTTRFVSTGVLPGRERAQTLVQAAHDRHAGDREGACSQVYPALAEVEPDLYGIALVSVDGAAVEVGDVAVEHPVMSVSKPFVFALLCDDVGVAAARDAIGANATGRAFNSLEAVERQADGRTNPMVNPGAIATTSWVPAADGDARWTRIHDGLSAFAGRRLQVQEAVYASASATNMRNRAITDLLHSYGRLGSDGDEALDLYTRQCSLAVSAHDLAVMGATLADGGVNPVTGEQVVSIDACRAALAVMTTAGMYETSGDWLYDVGLPAKSGIGGGIVAVAPGKGSLGVFGPRLDAAGNSVKGQLAARMLSRSLGLDLFVSQPVTAADDA